MANSQPPPGNTTFPVIAVAIIAILATALLLISYYTFVIKCCLNWHRPYFLNPFFSRVRDPDDNLDPPIAPTGSLQTRGSTHKGLDESIIRSIPVIKFRKMTDDSYECAVCLCELNEGETLRVIPNCCHAFHIDCIDVWLQSNANCPLCRSGISPVSILYDNVHVFDVPASGENNEDEDEDDDDFVVIEIEGNNLDKPKWISNREVLENERRYTLGHVYSMGDELIDIRKKDEEFEIEPIRRSISMDWSNERDFCIEVQESNKGSEFSFGGSSSKVRRSIFSFGYGRNSRCSVQPVLLDP